MNKIAILILIGFFPLLALQADDQEALAVSDKQTLLEAPFIQAREHMDRMFVIYIENPKTSRPQGVQKFELYEESLIYFSKNPVVKKHYEKFFKITPHTIATAEIRSRTLRELGRLKAEWSIRLLAQEMLVDRQGQQFNNGDNPPLTNDDIKLRLLNRRENDFLRNDTRAANILYKMNLSGMPADNTYRGPDSFLNSMRKWYLDNDHQIDKLMVEKWGDKAVLDENPEQEMLKENENTGEDQRDKAILEENLEQEDQEQTRDEFLQSPNILIPFLTVGIVILSLCYYCFLKKKK